jgi:hypothetical protein
MCLPTALALPFTLTGTSALPVIGSSARCYKSAVTIKSIEASFAGRSGQRESLKDERAFEEPESASGKARGGGGWGALT